MIMVKPVLRRKSRTPDWGSVLSSIATSKPAPIPEPKAKPNPVSGHHSRFFFKLLDDIVADQKEATKPKEVEYEDREVTKHVAEYSAAFTPALKTNVERIRKFFVEEIAPLTMALAPGSEQAKAVVNRMTGTEVSPEEFYRFEEMARKAVLIKLSIFLQTYLGLPDGAASN